MSSVCRMQVSYKCQIIYWRYCSLHLCQEELNIHLDSSTSCCKMLSSQCLSESHLKHKLGNTADAWEQMGRGWTWLSTRVQGTEFIQTEAGLAYNSFVQRVVSQPKFIENTCVCLKTAVMSVRYSTYGAREWTGRNAQEKWRQVCIWRDRTFVHKQHNFMQA